MLSQVSSVDLIIEETFNVLAMVIKHTQGGLDLTRPSGVKHSNTTPDTKCIGGILTGMHL